MYVDPAFERRGIGSAVLAKLETIAAARGIQRLSVDASVNAEAFYRRHGYTVLARRAHRLASGVEMACVAMEKQLGDREPAREVGPGN